MPTEMTWSNQQEAIFATKNDTQHLAVIARAGTGKTTTIREFLLRVPQTKKCYTVFNRRNKIEAEEKFAGTKIEVKTLNGLGFAYLRWSWRGVEPSGSVETLRAKEALAAVGASLPEPNRLVGDVKAGVAWAKGAFPRMPSFSEVRDLVERQGLCPEGHAAEDGWTPNHVTEAILHVLRASLVRRKDNLVSYDDQNWVPVVARLVRPWFELLAVDEAQDLTPVQQAMVKRAVKRGGRLVLIGDNRQAIYVWRGALEGGLQTMATELNAKVLPLTVTYRCPKAVVAVAQKMVPDFQSGAGAPEGLVDQVPEAKLLETARPGSAILSRVNAPLMPLCLQLLKAGVPAYIEGKNIGEKLANLVRKLTGNAVLPAVNFLAKLDGWRDRQVDRLSGEADEIEKQAEEIIDTHETLKALSAECDDTTQVLARLETLFDTSNGDKDRFVVLSTVHKAKGLEFGRVFILGSTFKKVDWESSRESETQNIGYVAVTRAKQHLTWVR